jgi:ParB family transcriptional regulator, chromosome partitioning protein
MSGIQLKGLKGLKDLNMLSTSVGKGEGQKGLKTLPVETLFPGQYQPRKFFDSEELKALSDSIKSQGIIQPLIVRQAQDRYEIIAGERRWRAAKLAGLTHVPAVISEISNETALAFGLIENIQREDLNPIEEAAALKRLIEEFEMTHEQVAESVGRSRAMVTNMLRLLNLSSEVQQKLIDKKIEVGHAKILAGVTAEDKQRSLANEVDTKKLTVRALENLINKKTVAGQGAQTDKPDLTSIQPLLDKLHQQNKFKIDVKLDRFCKGTINISVEDESEVKQLLERLLEGV